MKLPSPAFTALSLAIALGIALPAAAQERAPRAPTAAQQKSLDEARAHLDAVLAREFGVLLRRGVELRAGFVERLLLGGGRGPGRPFLCCGGQRDAQGDGQG